MAARVCHPCFIGFPLEGFGTCPACGGMTKYTVMAEPDDNWQEKVSDRREAERESDSEAARVLAWRVGRFQGMGASYDQAAKLARVRENGAYVMDVGRFNELRQKGWPVDAIMAAFL